MKITATISTLTSARGTRKLTLVPHFQGFVFVFDDTATVENGTYVDAENEFHALDKLKAIYADPDWRLRFYFS